MAKSSKAGTLTVRVRGRVFAHIVPEPVRRAAARERIERLRKTAKVGDVMSPSGEIWNAELGRY